MVSKMGLTRVRRKRAENEIRAAGILPDMKIRVRRAVSAGREVQELVLLPPLAVRPIPGGSHQGLRFADHAAATPSCDDDQGRTSQASAAGGTAEERRLLRFAGKARFGQVRWAASDSRPYSSHRIGEIAATPTSGSAI
jgi:hypothetical protein